MLLLIGIILVLVVLYMGYRFKAHLPQTQQTGASAVEVGTSLNVPDAGSDTIGSLNLPAYLPPSPSNACEAKRDFILNTNDHNIDPALQLQWAEYEMSHQVNAGQPNPDGLPQTGQFWLHGWTPLGPIDPMMPRNQQTGEVTPGPQDPQLAYGMAITAAMDAQEGKFYPREDPNDVSYQYRNQLQQIPGSHFQNTAASFDGDKNAIVVNRFAYLPEMSARYVVDELNKQMRKDHPCFSLAGREHFEISNPPMQCGDGSTVKHNPVSLIRVFESRVQKMEDGSQRVYLTMELGNLISAGSGGMFTTVVTVDSHQNFAGYTPLERDQKHTFVLPRTRT